MRPFFHRQFLFTFVFLLGSLAATAQRIQPRAVRLYRVGDNILRTDSLGNKPEQYSASAVSVRAFTSSLVTVEIYGTADYYPPAKLLNQSGTPYGTTVEATVLAYLVATTVSPSSGTATVDTAVVASRAYTDPRFNTLTTKANSLSTAVATAQVTASNALPASTYTANRSTDQAATTNAQNTANTALTAANSATAVASAALPASTYSTNRTTDQAATTSAQSTANTALSTANSATATAASALPASTYNSNRTADLGIVAGKEPALPTGTSAQYLKGDKTLGTLNQDVVPDGTNNKAYTASEKTKLGTIASGATANDTDANLKNRANHTGPLPDAALSDVGTAGTVGGIGQMITSVVRDSKGRVIGVTTVAAPTGAAVDTVNTLATQYYTNQLLTNSLIGALPTSTASLTLNSALQIFWHNETALPGEEVSIQGAFPANVTVQASLNDQTPYFSLPIVSQTTNFVKVRLPGFPALPANAVYTFFIKSGTGKSYSRHINRARATNFNSPDIYAGGPLAIKGRNLIVPGYTPTIRFVSQTNGVSLNGTYVATGSDPYKINVTCPLAITVGQTYSVFVSNGVGGSLAETQVIDETGNTATGVTAIVGTTDNFGLGIGFSNRFPVCTGANSTTLTGFNAQQTGFLSALNSALNTRSSAGGGCLVLPDGVYSLTATGSPFAGVDMPANVVLMGTSTAGTILQYGGAGTSISKVVYFDGSKSNAGLYNLTLTNLSTATSGFSAGLVNGQTFFIKDVVWNQGKQDGFEFNNSSRIIVKNSTLVNGPNTILHGAIRNASTNYLSVIGTTIRCMTMHIYADKAKNVFLENNVFDRDLSIGKINTTDDVHKVIINNVKGAYIARNAFKTTNGTVPRNLNDGEAILAEQPTNPDFDQGTVGSATTTTLTDATKAWPTTFDQAPVVMIIKGTGFGQWRTITSRTATVLTVSSPWAIVPDGTSTYAIFNWGLENYAIVNNSFDNEARGITMYHAPQYGGDIANNVLTNSGAIDITAIEEVLSATKRKFTPVINLNINDNTVSAETDLVNGASIGLQAIQHGVTTSWGTISTNLRVVRNTLNGNVPTNKPVIQDENFPESFNAYLVFHNTGSSYVDDNTPFILGSIFMNNTTRNVTVPYTLNTGSYHTTITRPIQLTTGTNSDSAIPNTAKASTLTITN
ncbi:RodZ family helix-turn-helix domain-containing protein [Spirosoma pollinicola]|uniref:Pectate lyase superfamily protein domain-containing protein n=1 Tax=Spirosoma pollinicola TaxID=2057025 RepID=A0A2K8YTN9_9BACT|nr:hypothetical protein [Spirosoma pollinicola]AUD00934.1 hypothetical protein CWM47_03350 [Spirosoma pollinicola]